MIRKGRHPSTNAPIAINTNRLPKLEPLVNAHVLAASMLYATRLHGQGTPDPEAGVSCREIDDDLIVACLVHATIGMGTLRGRGKRTLSSNAETPHDRRTLMSYAPDGMSSSAKWPVESVTARMPDPSTDTVTPGSDRSC